MENIVTAWKRAMMKTVTIIIARDMDGNRLCWSGESKIESFLVCITSHEIIVKIAYMYI